MTFQRFSDQLPDKAQAAMPKVPSGHPSAVSDTLANVERMEQARRPDAFTERQWFTLLRDLRSFTEHHLPPALGFGWSVLDLYGCHPSVAVRRWDLTGIALMLDGRMVESLTDDRITIVNRLGPPNTFYRRQPGCSAPADRTGAVPIWTAVLANAGLSQ